MSSMDRRAFITNGTLLALAAYTGRAAAQAAPHSAFPPGATAEDVTAGIDLSGKTIVVTGCNSGIGLETMRVLALRGAHVIGTARTAERGREACASVQGKTTPEVLELSDFDSVVACANAIRALDVAVQAGMTTVALTGVPGGKAAAVAQIPIRVPSGDTALVQEACLHLGHTICEMVEAALFPRPS